MDDCQVIDSTFTNLLGPAVHQTVGNGLCVMGNSFINCGLLRGGTPPYAEGIVLLEDGKNHKVQGNIGNKQEDGFVFVDIGKLDTSCVEICGNITSGFKTTGIGRLVLDIEPDFSSKLFKKYSHGLSDGDYGYLGVTSPGRIPQGLSWRPIYYVINATSDSFMLSKTLGGNPVTFTNNGAPRIHFYAAVPSLYDSFMNNIWS